MNNRLIEFQISAILQNSNASKQKLGQKLAYHFGLEPGPCGADEGIDGILKMDNGHILHFQCKLRSTPLDRDDARAYFSDINSHQANISIILSGVGFKDTFIKRLYGHKGIDEVEIHLLKLKDVFEKNDSFLKACQSLPPLRYLDENIKAEIG